jgi:cholesterol transport system auxiliary component
LQPREEARRVGESCEAQSSAGNQRIRWVVRSFGFGAFRLFQAVTLQLDRGLMSLLQPVFLRQARLSAAFAAALAVSACAAPPRATFDLATGAPKPLHAAQLRSEPATIVVETPKASELVDSDRIVIRDEGGDLAYLADAQWGDLAPRLVQGRLVAALEKNGVDAAYPGASAALRLQTELVRFEIDTARRAAVVVIAARLASERTGAGLSAARFVGEAPAPHTYAPEAANALDAALERAASRLALWTRAARPP